MVPFRPYPRRAFACATSRRRISRNRAMYSPTFGDNSLAGGPADADPESEVAAFANREQGRDGTTA